MLRRMLLCMTMGLLCLLPAIGLAQEAPLSWEEMATWHDALWQTLRVCVPQNDPAQTNDPQAGERWLYAYDFGVAEMSALALDGEENPIVEVEILTDAIACPRGIVVGDTLAAVLAAYPNENPQLAGSAQYAALYIREGESGSAWGWITRRNQTVQSVECVVSVLVEGMEGFRQELSLLYVIEDGRVSAIRAGGFGGLLETAQSDANVAAVREMAAQTEYVPQAQAQQATPLTGDSLAFAGIAFAGATPDAVIAVLGEPQTDQMTQEIVYSLRTLTYPFALLEFVGGEGAWQLEALLVTEAAVEGPGGLRVGDTLAEITARFGGGDLEDALVYRFEDAQGQAFALACTFHNDILTEYLLYRI